MMYSIRLKSTRCDRTFCISLIAIALLVLLLFYMASTYLPPPVLSLTLPVAHSTDDLAVKADSGFIQGVSNMGAMEKRRVDVGPKVIEVKRDNSETFYGIIFDAGSTGSRIHIFQLRKADPKAPAELVKETFKAIKPGLSSYAHDPKLGVLTLKPLLDLASQTIPKPYHKTTLIALKATAGLRLLPEDTANLILHEVRQLFSQYDFLFHKDDDDIAIMKGTDEGIYMWVTVNFLLGGLTRDTEKVATMDLGGGSTQITFVPSNRMTKVAHGTYYFNKESRKTLPKSKIHKTRLFGTSYHLYSHSYLGVGLMAARLASMGHRTTPKVAASPTLNVLSSPCLPANYVGNWSVQGTDLIMRGVDKEQTGYDNCYLHVRDFVTQNNITSIPELRKHPVYIFSYYYDRAVDASIIKSESGEKITPNHYKDAAKYLCKGHANRKKPFLCFDVTYIYSLLTDGFGLDPLSTLHIYKKINNIEMSWALGSMFGLMSESDPEQQVLTAV